jgi:hypothetical protein
MIDVEGGLQAGVGGRRILLRGTGAPLLDDPEARKAYLGL